MEPEFIKNLKSRLQQGLPGKVAQNKMKVKPEILSKSLFYENIKPAAVLILLYPFKGDWYFLLTKRSQTVDYHKGQISLPGGMIEKNELQQDAAKRETYEEIGVLQKEIKIIGSLTKIFIPISGFEIFPFISWTNIKPKTNLQTMEVEKVFSISIKSLIDNKAKKNKKSILYGKPVTIPYFDLENQIVWGATSTILSEFKFILADIL